MRTLGAIAATALLAGCAGMKMDEGAAIRRASLDPEIRAKAKEQKRSPDDVAEQYTLIPIDGKLIATQASERVQRREAAPADPLAADLANYAYRVKPFDVLSVTVWDHPELTIPAGEFRAPELTGSPVVTDGTMFYPHVGVVEVAGKTLPEIRNILTQRLAKVIEKPQLDVRVAAFRSQKVVVTGEVMAPSTIPVTDVPIRALDAIAASRGVTPDSDLSNVTLTRDGKTIRLNLLAATLQGDVAQNWVLKDGDVLNVGNREQNRVFVLGEVKRPSTKPMRKDGTLTLADALGDSEGFDPIAANTGRIYVLRGDFDRPRIFRLDASSPDALLLATQFQMEPRDVVFVSTTEVARWNRVISQMVPTIQGIWQAFDITRRSIP